MFYRLRDWLTTHPARTVAWGWMLTLAVIVLVGVGMVRCAQAADATAIWTNPTQRVDGTALAPGELRETQIDYAKCVTGTNNFPAIAEGTKAFAYPAATGVIPGLAYGKWCFRARAIDTGSVASDNSGTVWVQYLAPPKPPVLSASITIAYETWRFQDKTYLGRSVGTVPLGTPCGAAVYQSFSVTYYEIPRESVTLAKVPKAGPLVTQCTATS
jgi:hypothetical protein